MCSRPRSPAVTELHRDGITGVSPSSLSPERPPPRTSVPHSSCWSLRVLPSYSGASRLPVLPWPLLSPCCCPQAEDVTRTLLSYQRRDLSHQAGDALAASRSQDSFTMAVACCPAETRAPTPALDCCRDSGFCPVSRGGL